MYQNSNRKQQANQRRRTNFANSFKAAEPEIFQMVSYVRRNGEVKRHVSLAIINMMKQRGLIPEDAKCYVNFLLNRYSIKIDGLATEHKYSNEIFIRALLASCMSISTYVQIMVNNFLNEYEHVGINDSEYNTIAGKKKTEAIALYVANHISDVQVVNDDDNENEVENKELKEEK